MAAAETHAERWRLLSTVAEYAGEELSGPVKATSWQTGTCPGFRHGPRKPTTRLLQDGHEPIDTEGPNLRRALDRALEHDPATRWRWRLR